MTTSVCTGKCFSCRESFRARRKNFRPGKWSRQPEAEALPDSDRRRC